MHQSAVAGGVPIGIVDFFKVVDVQHAEGQRHIAPVGACAFAFQQLIQTAPVQAAGQLVFLHLVAHFCQFFLKRCDPRFGIQHFLLRRQHHVVRLPGFALHMQGIGQQRVDDGIDFLY